MNFQNSFAWWLGMPKLIFGYSNFSGSGHFLIRQAQKTLFFTSFSAGPPEFCPGWIFNFLPKSGRPGLGIRPQPKISIYECIFLMSCELFYLGHFFFCFVGFFSAFPHWTVTWPWWDSKKVFSTILACIRPIRPIIAAQIQLESLF